MTFSCSDFTDGMLEAMGEHGFVRADDLPGDNPGRQFDVAAQAIHKLGALVVMAGEVGQKLLESGALSEEMAAEVKKLMHGAGNIAPAYLVCDSRGHMFSGKSETETRWVMDLASGQLVIAQYFKKGWRDIGRDDVRDLLESLRDANNVRENPEDFGVVTADTLPEW